MADLDIETVMPEVLRAFYGRVREDELLGPVFNRAVHDWDEHLESNLDFWSSVMLGIGREKGDPVSKHLPHAGQIDATSFERWLKLWSETTSEMLPAQAAKALRAEAARIAESLQLAIRFPSPAQKASLEKAIRV